MEGALRYTVVFSGETSVKNDLSQQNGNMLILA